MMSDITIMLKRLHRKAFIDLDSQIAPTSDEFRRVKSLAEAHLAKGTVYGCNNINDLLDELEISGKIKIGEYTVLKELLRDANLLGEALDIVLRAESAIAKAKSGAGGPKDSAQETIPERWSAEVKRVISESETYRSFCRQKTDGSFVETTQCKRAKAVIEKEHTLVIIGHSGYGKSSFLQHISATTCEYLPIQCSNPEEIRNYISIVQNINIKLLFVVDEPFGGSFVQRKLLNSWASMGKKLEMYLGKHRFLFATRSSVWADCEVHFDTNPLFCNKVEFTPAYLTDGDKVEMIRKYLGNSGKLTDRDVDTIVSIKNPVAFCQCCKLMGDAIKKGHQSGEELIRIFEKPFSYLISALDKIKDKEKVKYATLCLLALCGDIKCRELTGTLSQVTSDVRERIEVVWEACGCEGPLQVAVTNLQDCAEKLSGTFLHKIRKTGEDSTRIEVYTFHHDSIHEAVIMHYGNRHFRHCLQYLPHDLLVKISRPQNYDKGEHDFVVCVPDDVENSTELMKIFTEMAIVGNCTLYDVFQNPFVRDESFQDAWVEYLKAYPEKLAAFVESKSWDGMCVRCLSLQSGASTLWRFIDLEGHRCKCQADANDPLSEATSRDDKLTVTNLMKSHKQTNNQINTAFLVACRHGSINVLEMFLGELEKDRRDATIATGLKEACRFRQREIVRFLLESYYSPCKKEKCGCREGIMWAALGGQTDIVLDMLCHGTYINILDNDGGTCLHWAARYGQTETVQELIVHGVNINLTNNDGWTGLHYAAYDGHIETVQKLLDHGAEINIKNNDEQSGLHLAGMKGHIETVQTLLEHGADVNITDNDGQTCLHLAAMEGHTETVHKFLGHGADINITDKDGRTETHLAAHYGHTETVQKLLDHGADVNIKNDDGQTGLHLAAMQGHLETVQTLLDHGADINITGNDGQTCLHLAAMDGHIDTVQKLLDNGADINIPDYDGQIDFYLAAYHGHTERVHDLLVNGMNINITNNHDWTGLHLAAMQGHIETVQKLLDHGADINITNDDGESGLHLAGMNGHIETVQTLLDHGADINITDNDGQTCLHLAAMKGHIETVQTLLDHGADMNIADNDGQRDFHLAAYYGQTETVQKLLDHGADIHIRDNDGQTCLHLAALEGHNETVQKLLDLGADINTTDNDGQTCLHLTAMMGHIETAQKLLEHGADINSRTNQGLSSLHYAARYGHIETVEKLLHHGADINSTNDDGQTALHLAATDGHKETVQKLLDHGADININATKNNTALSLAKSEGHMEIVNMLTKFEDCGKT